MQKEIPIPSLFIRKEAFSFEMVHDTFDLAL
jgi:hypothetical protein